MKHLEFNRSPKQALWGGGVRHNLDEILGGFRANLPLLRGGYCVIFLLVRLIFRSPPPLLIIIAQSLSRNFLTNYQLQIGSTIIYLESHPEANESVKYLFENLQIVI